MRPVLRLVAGGSHPALAAAVAAALGAEPATTEVEHFPDGEVRPVVAAGRGDDVYVLQPTGPPVAEHLVELLLLVDACRRAGASRVTAVVPYFGYARQDRRSRAGQGIGLRVAVDAVAGAGADRLVVVDPHTAGFEAASPVPVVALTALGLLADTLEGAEGAPRVVVAPDLGAVTLAERLAAPRQLPVAVVRKTRISGTRVRAEELVGEVAGRQPVIVDDMIATGATIEAAVHLLRRHRCAGSPVVAAVHGLLVGAAPERLAALGVSRLVVTDSVPVPAVVSPPVVESCPLAPMLADAIGRLHRDEPVDDLGRFG